MPLEPNFEPEYPERIYDLKIELFHFQFIWTKQVNKNSNFKTIASFFMFNSLFCYSPVYRLSNILKMLLQVFCCLLGLIFVAVVAIIKRFSKLPVFSKS